jgi:hypothetical protein
LLNLISHNSAEYEAARQMKGAVANIAINAVADGGTAATTTTSE